MKFIKKYFVTFLFNFLFNEKQEPVINCTLKSND